MRRATRLGWVGLGMVGLGMVGLGLIVAGPLRARQMPLGPVVDINDCRPIQANTILVAAPPHSVAWTRTWLQLQKVVSLNYPDGIKLGDLVKRVREATIAPELGWPRGVSIYVDVNGLAEADRTIDSAVTIDLDGVALHKALTLGLKQLGLIPQIDEDGLLVITSPNAGDEDVPTDPAEAEWTRLDQIHGRLGSLNSQVASLRREVALLREALHASNDAGVRPAGGSAPTTTPAPSAPAPSPPAPGGEFP